MVRPMTMLMKTAYVGPDTGPEKIVSCLLVLLGGVVSAIILALQFDPNSTSDFSFFKLVSNSPGVVIAPVRTASNVVILPTLLVIALFAAYECILGVANALAAACK